MINVNICSEKPRENWNGKLQHYITSYSTEMFTREHDCTTRKSNALETLDMKRDFQEKNNITTLRFSDPKTGKAFKFPPTFTDCTLRLHMNLH